MTRRLLLALGSCAFVGSLASSAGATGVTDATGTKTAPLTCATSRVDSWTTDALAHEVVVVSLQSTSLVQMRQAAAAGFGGELILGSVVPAGLVPTLQSLPSLAPSKLRLNVMADEEGGGVTRLPALVGSWPWAQVMGATMTAPQITAVGARLGRAMANAGFTTDLAPVADVDGRQVYPSASNPDGYRSFGGSPSAVAADATAFAQGLRQSGINATVKHFPGLGGSSGNTDTGAATTLPWATLQRSALYPFRVAISAGVPMVMMSNAVVPGLTGQPAGLSRAAVAALRALGFHGLVITDALGAGAISARHLTEAQAGVLALVAGDDELLSQTPTTAASSLTNASAMVRAIDAAEATGTLTRATLIAAAAQVVATTNPGVCAAG